MAIDTHTHLYLPEFQPAPADAVKRAINAGVTHMVFPNVDLSTIEHMKRLHDQFPDSTSMAMGLHPTEIGPAWKEDIEVTDNELRTHQSDYVAVGEIGIDLYWDKTHAEAQMQAFEHQCRMAVELNLPVIIHCRDGLEETVEVIEGIKGLQGVFHSFGGSVEDVELIRRRAGDFYFGINGIVTFKNCSVRNTLPTITPDRLLLETDSPYLAPVPHRGKRNESAYIIHTAAHIASHLGIPVEELDSITTANARTLFRL